MVQYYTLQEAAAKLRLSADALKEMAKNGELRAFQDRGNLRFRAQEVDELARVRGLSSEPDLQLGDAPPAAPEQRPAKAVKSDPSVFDFTLGTDDSDEVSLGQDLTPSSGRHQGAKSGPQKSGPPKSGPGRSPTPKPGSGARSPQPSASDSDVRLVSDGTGLDFQVELDRGSHAGKEPPSSHRSGSSRRGKSKPDQADSGVRIVPLDKATDSDVKMVPDPAGSNAPPAPKRGTAPSDSDIRMESGGRRGRDDTMVTEEIDLDAEARKADAAGQSSRIGKPKRTQIGPGGAQASPFELSPQQPGATGSGASKSSKSGVRPPVTRKDPDTSSEFELTPADARPASPPRSSTISPKSPGASGIRSPGASGVSKPAGSSSATKGPAPSGTRGPGGSAAGSKPGGSAAGSKPGATKVPPPKAPQSEDVPLLMGDEDVNLGELTGASGGSGINLQDPADSGISLEQGGSNEMEFELSLDSGKTPAPQPAAKGEKEESSSSNEFELSLDSDSASDSDPGAQSDSDSESEFELSLDVPEGSSVKVEEGAQADSDSEFELSLDEAGELAPAEAEGGEENKDIFETDFEVPALEEGSDSEAVALEEGSELESSSDFELDLTDEPTSEGDSGSQVVALDEGSEADEGAETVAKPRRPAAKAALAAEEEAEGELDEDLEGDLGEEPEPAGETVYVTAPAAEWGLAPAIGLTLSAIVLSLATLMTFELMHGIWSFHRGAAVTGPVTHTFARMFDDSLPKD